MEPIVIACAITGSVPRKNDSPSVSTMPAEQIESTHAAFEAACSLVHIHARDDDENRHRLATWNAKSVSSALEVGAKHGRRSATVAEARAALGL